MHRVLRTLEMLLIGAAGSLATDQVALGQQAPDLIQEVEIAKRAVGDLRVREALAYVDRSHEETVQEWLGLCRAYAPTGEEIYRARYVSRLFQMYGLENVHVDEYSNVTGIRRGSDTGPTIVFNALLDAPAIWPKDQPIEPIVAEGRVWCPGASAGVSQVLSILRALNAGKIRTRGDIWFVVFAAENFGGLGSTYWIQGNYPYNVDWHRGDIMVNFNGGGGTSVWVGSGPYIHWSKLRIFTPIDRSRFERHSVDALARAIQRIRAELGMPQANQEGEVLQLNMATIEGSPIVNAQVPEASVSVDLRSSSMERLEAAHRRIQDIAREVCQELECSYHYAVTMKQGSEGIEGWDKLNNRPARMAAAAAKVLYGVDAVIDSTVGCGDCRRLYEGGMPAISLRGNVYDYGTGRFEVVRGRRAVESALNRRSGGFYHSTAAEDVDRLWSGIKQGILFAASYSGLSEGR